MYNNPPFNFLKRTLQQATGNAPACWFKNQSKSYAVSILQHHVIFTFNIRTFLN